MLWRLSRLARRFSAGWYRASYFGRRIGDKRIVAGLATMPSRAASFPVAFRSIVHQVDRLYLYLDGHQEVPEVARSDRRVIPIFRRTEAWHRGKIPWASPGSGNVPLRWH
jgi:hypothetical protein